MIGARLYLAGGLALLIALGGWALYRQIGISGELRAQLQQQVEATEAANAQVSRIEAENARRNQLIMQVTNERDEAIRKSGKIRTVARTVVAESADACIKAPVPDDVARAARGALDELWGSADTGGQGGDVIPSPGVDAGLRAP